MLFRDIAWGHNLKVALVQSIASKVKHNPAFLQELRAKRDRREECEEAIKATVKSFLDSGKLIENASQIKARVFQD